MIDQISPPRSWPKTDQMLFATLPYGVQLIIEKRERDRDSQIRTMQNEFAKLKRELHANTKTIADTAS